MLLGSFPVFVTSCEQGHCLLKVHWPRRSLAVMLLGSFPVFVTSCEHGHCLFEAGEEPGTRLKGKLIGVLGSGDFSNNLSCCFCY